MGAGIDYSGPGSMVNRNVVTGIRYGVIHQNEVLQAWADSSEPDYGRPEEAVECPECGALIPVDGVDWGDDVECQELRGEFQELCDGIVTVDLPDDAEPFGYYLDDGEYTANAGDDGDIFIISSPYYTLCRFCSPCAPGAGYLMSPDPEGIRAYCFGHDWFDDSAAAYPVYSVETGKEVHQEIFQEAAGGWEP